MVPIEDLHPLEGGGIFLPPHTLRVTLRLSFLLGLTGRALENITSSTHQKRFGPLDSMPARHSCSQPGFPVSPRCALHPQNWPHHPASLGHSRRLFSWPPTQPGASPFALGADFQVSLGRFEGHQWVTPFLSSTAQRVIWCEVWTQKRSQ
ncbi:hypothetical protein EDB86DRAFT_2917094 [Lactarius hatsudake]|nr:hypothetical protein EDB86DRAFT_2917094 [Lactarius hatsudake]